MKKINAWFGLNTVRKKVLLLSKLAGGIIVLFLCFYIGITNQSKHSLCYLVWAIGGGYHRRGRYAGAFYFKAAR